MLRRSLCVSLDEGGGSVARVIEVNRLSDNHLTGCEYRTSILDHLDGKYPGVGVDIVFAVVPGLYPYMVVGELWWYPIILETSIDVDCCGWTAEKSCGMTLAA